jgi:hypothetical protein
MLATIAAVAAVALIVALFALQGDGDGDDTAPAARRARLPIEALEVAVVDGCAVTIGFDGNRAVFTQPA